MRSTIKHLILPFYFGSINDDERLLVEREILSDPEFLVDYLDLKRNFEAANSVPQSPSGQLWHRLQEQIPARKKLLLSLSVGTAVAVSLLTFFVLFLKPETTGFETVIQGGILFDSSSELPASSSVL